jgi:hypothetical protein
MYGVFADSWGRSLQTVRQEDHQEILGMAVNLKNLYF